MGKFVSLAMPTSSVQMECNLSNQQYNNIHKHLFSAKAGCAIGFLASLFYRLNGRRKAWSTFLSGPFCQEEKSGEKVGEAKAVKLYGQIPPIEKMDASLSTLANCE